MVEFVVKRDGRTVKFNKQLIVRAIEKADVPRDVAEKIADEISARKSTILSVEDIQDLVEKKLMRSSYTKEAQNYVRFRYRKELLRESEALNESLLDIIENKNEAVSEENSNKNSLVLSTQRDYMAGEVSKYLSKRFFLDPDVVEAHNKEIIHVHDLDYFAQHLFNCCLVNLEDVLQNGTVINKTFISKPHSFSTACNIATQVMAAVSSNQLGGQSESLAHLAPFVDESRKRIRLKVEKELEEFKTILSPEVWRDKVEDITETRVKDEVKRGVQTIQYQINTLMTTNGKSLPL